MVRGGALSVALVVKRVVGLPASPSDALPSSFCIGCGALLCISTEHQIDRQRAGQLERPLRSGSAMLNRAAVQIFTADARAASSALRSRDPVGCR